MLAGMYAGDAGKLVAWDQALTSDMILSQPVVYEFERIAVPTVLMIGQKDTTAIGKDRAPPEIAQTLGNYPELGRMANRRIGNSTLVALPSSAMPFGCRIRRCSSRRCLSTALGYPEGRRDQRPCDPLVYRRRRSGRHDARLSAGARGH